jgi:hypothetical protein
MFDTACTHPAPGLQWRRAKPETLIMRARASIKSYGAYYDTNHSQSTASLDHIQTCKGLVWVYKDVGELY